MPKAKVTLEVWKEPGEDRVHVKLLGSDDDNTYSIHERRNHGSPLLFKALDNVLQRQETAR